MYNSQETYSRIKLQSKIQEKSISELNRYAELGENAISQSAKSSEGMKAKNLYSIAECLDCSVDYLLGRTDNPTSHKQQSLEMVSNAPINGSYNMNAGNISVSNSGLNPYQSELIGQFNKLTTIQQAKLLSFVSDIVDGKTNL